MADELVSRLSQIVTQWTLLREAHGSEHVLAKAAQSRLLESYGGAVRRYLLGCVRQQELADELFQEFAVRLLQGGLRGASPEKGRFRHFIKGVLFHLLADHHHGQKRQPATGGSQLPDPADTCQPPDADAEFLTNWRAELLAKAWVLLEGEEKRTGQPWHTALAYRRDHADERSEAMAEALSQQLGRPLNAAAVRQLLHRARERFADLLLDQVMHSLAQPSLDALYEELRELNLLHYCQPALDRYQHGST
jgi:DNA-directed RNA polymerase specialized sigma24 family protein